MKDNIYTQTCTVPRWWNLLTLLIPDVLKHKQKVGVFTYLLASHVYFREKSLNNYCVGFPHVLTVTPPSEQIWIKTKFKLWFRPNICPMQVKHLYLPPNIKKIIFHICLMGGAPPQLCLFVIYIVKISIKYVLLSLDLEINIAVFILTTYLTSISWQDTNCTHVCVHETCSNGNR